jgi:hypothetical protein
LYNFFILEYYKMSFVDFLNTLFDEIITIIINSKIFLGTDEDVKKFLYIQKKLAIKDALKGCARKDKLNLTYLLNDFFSGNLQYNNVSGFDLIEFKGNQRMPFSVGVENAEEWDKKMKESYQNLINASNSNSKYVILSSEDYKTGGKAGDVPNLAEFNCYTNYDETTLSTGKEIPIEELVNECYHSYHEIGAYSFVNFHVASGNADEAVATLKKFITKCLKVQKEEKEETEDNEDRTKEYIFGGDSNIYYNNETKGGDGTKNIIDFKNTLAELDPPYDLYISNSIVAKERPSNFFQNAQTAFKTELNIEDTMFIAVPNTMKPEALINCIKVEDVIPQFKVKSAFLACKKGGRPNDDDLWSDHNPIGLKIGGENEMSILFTNNVSIKGKRGLVDNRNNPSFCVSPWNLKLIYEKPNILELTTEEIIKKTVELIETHLFGLNNEPYDPSCLGGCSNYSPDTTITINFKDAIRYNDNQYGYLTGAKLSLPKPGDQSKSMRSLEINKLKTILKKYSKTKITLTIPNVMPGGRRIRRSRRKRSGRRSLRKRSGRRSLRKKSGRRNLRKRSGRRSLRRR